MFAEFDVAMVTVTSAEQILLPLDFNNSRYHVKTELNNCFIMHPHPSAILFLRRTLQAVW